MLPKSLRSTALASLAGFCLLVSPALAEASTTITFDSETTGSKPNGYTVAGVSFSDTLGANLTVSSWSESNGSRALGVFGDDTSALQMVFASTSTDLSLWFGNDEVCIPGQCPWGADRAILQLFLGGIEVGSTFVLFNQNNVADQMIGISGIAFDEALFFYGDSNLQAANLVEIVDNISFSQAAAVPEPGTWAMMLMGFGAVGFAMRRSRKSRMIQQLV